MLLEFTSYSKMYPLTIHRNHGFDHISCGINDNYTKMYNSKAALTELNAKLIHYS